MRRFLPRPLWLSGLACLASAAPLLAQPSRPITVDVDATVENGEFFKTCHADYDGGERYPHLVAESAKPDLLTAIIRPLAPPPSSAKAKP